MKAKILKNLSLLMLGFFIGVFMAAKLKNRTQRTKPHSSGIVKTDAGGLNRLRSVRKELENTPTLLVNKIVRRKLNGVLDTYSNYIVSPPVVTEQSFDKLKFKIYKNKYEIDLDSPRTWIGAGYGYPWGVRISAGYRVKNNIMIFTVLSKESVSVSAALFL